MDSLTFIDHLIGHLAWPLTISGLGLFVLIRRPRLVQGLLDRIHKGRVAGFEFELAEVKASADRAGLPPAPLPSAQKAKKGGRRPSDNPVKDLLDRLVRVAITNPRRAVTEAYAIVDQLASAATQYMLNHAIERYGDGSPEAEWGPAASIRA